MSEKRCPFMSLRGIEGDSFKKCMDEKCELWNDDYDRCSFYALSKSLEGIAYLMEKKYGGR